MPAALLRFDLFCFELLRMRAKNAENGAAGKSSGCWTKEGSKLTAEALSDHRKSFFSGRGREQELRWIRAGG